MSTDNKDTAADYAALLAENAILLETILALEATITARHSDVSRLDARVGRLEESLRLVGLGDVAKRLADLETRAYDEYQRGLRDGAAKGVGK